MVHTYTLPGAVEVTRKVLERICRNDLLQSLSANSEQQAAVPGEVPCDVCTGSKLKALKSCMVCLTSYCEMHLEPHLTASRLRRHQLVEPLSHSEDHLHLLQCFSSLKTVLPLLEAELERVQQYAVDVTLDPDTANSRLILSDDGKQVHCGDVRKNLPDIPQRFSPCPNVLGKQSLSSGRFYFEVQVKGKTAWDLGVASKLDGFWSIGLRNGNEYRAFASPSVRLCLQSGPEKVGVFVDYEEGLVSFYDVDTAALIYSFTSCSFIQKLHPYFSPSQNDCLFTTQSPSQ
uniref:B30.2/SPRY domain-containing protein n=1 Tax=Oreochromis niloticus TaxID=8128 RepID=A0A669E2Y7_ORENI